MLQIISFVLNIWCIFCVSLDEKFNPFMKMETDVVLCVYISIGRDKIIQYSNSCFTWFDQGLFSKNKNVKTVDFQLLKFF